MSIEEIDDYMKKYRIDETIKENILSSANRLPSPQDISGASVVEWENGKPKFKNISPKGFMIGDRIRMGLQQGVIVDINEHTLYVENDEGEIMTWNDRVVRKVK